MGEAKIVKPYLQRWWVWVIVIAVIFFVIGAFGNNEESLSDRQTSAEETSPRAMPEYRVLDKIEHISTRMSDDDARYFGDILIQEDVMHIQPDEFAILAKIIAEQEGIEYSANFYQTVESYEANVGIIVPEENREMIERLGGLEDGQRYLPESEKQRLLDEGFIGALEDGEFRMSPSSAYYQRHLENS
jgi:hypothetical protein